MNLEEIARLLPSFQGAEMQWRSDEFPYSDTTTHFLFRGMVRSIILAETGLRVTFEWLMRAESFQHSFPPTGWVAEHDMAGEAIVIPLDNTFDVDPAAGSGQLHLHSYFWSEHVVLLAQGQTSLDPEAMSPLHLFPWPGCL